MIVLHFPLLIGVDEHRQRNRCGVRWGFLSEVQLWCEAWAHFTINNYYPWASQWRM